MLGVYLTPDHFAGLTPDGTAFAYATGCPADDMISLKMPVFHQQEGSQSNR
ncbi:hypothetical protein M2447_002027 [Ereboglobus sp. PH5-10]|nr:hypothetical protein [Ereboglobus sp. PH5-10]